MFLWITGETDGHYGNFLAKEKRLDDFGNPVYSIIKIDNALSFPESNDGFLCHLIYLPNAMEKMSPSLQKKIREINVEELVSILKDLGLDNTTDALRERIAKMQELVSNHPEFSIKQYLNIARSFEIKTKDIPLCYYV